jgi:hypothetical protein
MAEFLGLGLSHFGGFMYADAAMAARVATQLKSGKLPPEVDSPEKWPDGLRAEWSNDEGAGFAARHRAAYFGGVDRVRAALEAFAPDAVVIFGDDQYECFREDLVPPYCVFAGDEFVLKPFVRARAVGGEGGNIWNEPPDTEIRIPGAPDVARAMLAALNDAGFDPAYSLRLPHQDYLGHAFANTLTHLDYKREGWRWPIVPFAINAYGASLIRAKGGLDATAENLNGIPDPGGPTPVRCFDMGRAIAEGLAKTDWRIALVATASLSHAFLTTKNHCLYPDIDSDRARFAELKSGDWRAWRDVPLEVTEDAGQHELVNWCPMLGAMEALGHPAPAYCEMFESWLMVSDKVVAVIPAA